MDRPKRFSGRGGLSRGSTKPRGAGFKSRKLLSQSMGSLSLSDKKQEDEEQSKGFSFQTNNKNTKSGRNFSRGKSRISQSTENLTQLKTKGPSSVSHGSRWHKPNDRPTQPREG